MNKNLKRFIASVTAVAMVFSSMPNVLIGAEYDVPEGYNYSEGVYSEVPGGGDEYVGGGYGGYYPGYEYTGGGYGGDEYAGGGYSGYEHTDGGYGGYYPGYEYADDGYGGYYPEYEYTGGDYYDYPVYEYPAEVYPEYPAETPVSVFMPFAAYDYCDYCDEYPCVCDYLCYDCDKYPCECPCYDCDKYPCICEYICEYCEEYPCVCPCEVCYPYPCTCPCEECEEYPCVCEDGANGGHPGFPGGGLQGIVEFWHGVSAFTTPILYTVNAGSSVSVDFEVVVTQAAADWLGGNVNVHFHWAFFHDPEGAAAGEYEWVFDTEPVLVVDASGVDQRQSVSLSFGSVSQANAGAYVLFAYNGGLEGQPVAQSGELRLIVTGTGNGDGDNGDDGDTGYGDNGEELETPDFDSEILDQLVPNEYGEMPDYVVLSIPGHISSLYLSYEILSALVEAESGLKLFLADGAVLTMSINLLKVLHERAAESEENIGARIFFGDEVPPADEYEVEEQDEYEAEEPVEYEEEYPQEYQEEDVFAYIQEDAVLGSVNVSISVGGVVLTDFGAYLTVSVPVSVSDEWVEEDEYGYPVFVGYGRFAAIDKAGNIVFGSLDLETNMFVFNTNVPGFFVIVHLEWAEYPEEYKEYPDDYEQPEDEEVYEYEPEYGDEPE